MMKKAYVKFKQGDLKKLKTNLLQSPTLESYALLLGKTEAIGNMLMIKIYQIRFPKQHDYLLRTSYQVKVHRQFLQTCLSELDAMGWDTLIEVHTHPYAKEKPKFSTIDQNHEQILKDYLHRFDPPYQYGSLLFSPTNYNGRFYSKSTKTSPISIEIKTQTIQEYNDVFPSLSLTQTITDSHHRFKQYSHSYFTFVTTSLLEPQLLIFLQENGFNNYCVIQLNQDSITLNEWINGKKVTDSINISRDNVKHIRPWVAKSDSLIVYSNDEALNDELHQLAFLYYIPFIFATTYTTYRELQLSEWQGLVITGLMGEKVCYRCLNDAFRPRVAQPNRHSKVRNRHIRNNLLPNPYERPLLPVDLIMANLALEQFLMLLSNQVIQPLLIYKNDGVPRLFSQKDLSERNLHCPYCSI